MGYVVTPLGTFLEGQEPGAAESVEQRIEEIESFRKDVEKEVLNLEKAVTK